MTTRAPLRWLAVPLLSIAVLFCGTAGAEP